MTSLHVLLPCICRRLRAKWQLCALTSYSSPADICCCPKPAGGQDPTSAACLQHQPSQHEAPNACWICYPPLPSHCRQPDTCWVTLLLASRSLVCIGRLNWQAEMCSSRCQFVSCLCKRAGPHHRSLPCLNIIAVPWWQVTHDSS